MYLVYVTYPSVEEAQTVSRSLIESRLAACANILPAHQSMYWWDGEIQESAEVAVIYKTKPAVFDRFKDHCEELHSNEVPCIVALPIHDGHKPFLAWIAEQTGEEVREDGLNAKGNWTL